MPPPAIQTLKANGMVVAAELCVGLAPVAVLAQRRAAELAGTDDQRLSSRPRCFRSLSRAATGWSAMPQLQ